jgi:lipoate-protein ligase A
MPLFVLPHREGSAAENMAHDFLLLQHARAGCPVLRHYGWREPAFTFGLSQAISYVRAQLPPGSFDLCRRPSGGGLVDHRNDWTFGLVFPRGHFLCEMDARESYRIVHEAVAGALRNQGEDVMLRMPEETDRPHAPQVCFDLAEVYDVIRADGQKVAGAAQKRNKHGLLIQGSIERGRLSAGLEWQRFETEFAELLARAAGEADAESSPWPEFPEGLEDQLVAHYSSDEWIARR